MAGLSIKRRRKAWLKGVAMGATGKGKCRLVVPKLLAIYQKGMIYGQANATTNIVQSIVAQLRPRRKEVVVPQRQRRRSRRPQF